MLLAVLLWTPPAVFLCRYWQGLEVSKGAADLGLAQLLIAGTIVMLVALAPWNELRLRLRKVGFIEFETALSNQAREHVKEFAELRARLDEFETRVRAEDSVGPIAEHLAQVDLAPVLIQFLEEFRPKAFSPLKIHRWGGRQRGYEKLATYPQGAIRIVLQELVSNGKVAVRVSRLGNTLYRIAE